MRPFLPLLTIALVLTGCTEGAPTNVSLDEAAPVGLARTLGGHGAPESTLEERGRALVFSTLAVVRAAESAASWEELDAHYRALFAEATPVERWALQQTAAFEMADRHLLRGSATPEKASAAAYYLPFIVDAEGPEVDVVSDVLSRYAPLLDGAEVTALARRAAEVGRAHLAKGCGERCLPDDPRIRSLGLDEAQYDARDVRVAEAVAALDALAAR